MKKQQTNFQTTQLRVDLNSQINQHKVNIDKSCFIKTDEEKELLKELKKTRELNAWEK